MNQYLHSIDISINSIFYRCIIPLINVAFKVATCSCGSRFGQPSAEMASADTYDAAMQDETLTIEEMQALQAVFAKEAFEFLLHNAQTWIEYPKDFMIRFTYPENGIMFTRDVGKAIITIAYLYRREYSKRDWYPVNFARDITVYEDCVRSYSFPKNNIYFYHYLAWVAFIFDFTMYCYKRGYDYIERGKQFIAEYPYLEYFHFRGGFHSLIKFSVYMGVFYDNIEPIIGHELSEDEVIVPFIKRLDKIERRNRYSNNRWLLITPEMQYASQIRKKLSAKYDVVSSYDHRRVIPGYRVILRKSPTKSTQNISPKSPKKHVSEAPKLDSGEKDNIVIDLTSQIEKTMSGECVGDSNFFASNGIIKKSPTKSKVLVSEASKLDSGRKDDLVVDLTSRMDKTTISEAKDNDFSVSKVIKKSPTKCGLKISPKSSKVLISEAQTIDDEKDDVVIDLTSRMDKTTMSEGCAADRDSPASKIKPSFTSDTDDSNSVFIIHKRFLTRRKASRKDSKYKRGLKIYPPSKNRDIWAMNLNKILDENIDNGSYKQIRNSVYAVVPPGRCMDDEATRIIVLDTSSEEEDYSCPKQLHEIADVIWSRYLERMRIKSESEKDGSEQKDTADILSEQPECMPSKRIESESEKSAAEMSTEQISEKSKISEAKSVENTNPIPSWENRLVLLKSVEDSKEVSPKIPTEQRMLNTVSSKSTDAVSKENGTVVKTEQKTFAVTKSTGAIPKERKNVSRRRRRKDRQTDNRNRNLEAIDQNNNE